MYHICGKADAQVGIYADYGLATQVQLGTLYVDDSFGEMCILGERRRTATAKALSDVELEEVKAEDFEAYAKDHPVRLSVILQNVSNRLRDLTADYKRACATLASYAEAKEKGEPISKELMVKMEKYAKR